MRSQEQWQLLLAEFQRSSLTQHAFCKERGITGSCFSKWRKKLETPSDQPLFVDLGVMPSADTAGDDDVTPPAWHIELELGKGIVLRLRSA
jgi:hypothetical protein